MIANKRQEDGEDGAIDGSSVDGALSNNRQKAYLLFMV